MDNDTTILIRPSSLYPVYLPAAKARPAQWINLALARQIIIVNVTPLKVAIKFGPRGMVEYEGEQASSILVALDEAAGRNTPKGS